MCTEKYVVDNVDVIMHTCNPHLLNTGPTGDARGTTARSELAASHSMLPNNIELYPQAFQVEHL